MRHPSLATTTVAGTLATAPALLALLTFVLGAVAPAHAQVTLGRLFSTPAERAAMDASRGASATLAPNSQGEQTAPGMPGGPPMSGGPSMPGAADPAAGVGGPAAANAAPPPPPTLVMSGVLRRSGSHATTVWLNDQPQSSGQNSLAQRGGAAAGGVTVTLPSGKKVMLKPGQRYDLNQGRVKDVNEP